MSVPYVRVLEVPSFEPVTLAEARLWCRVDDDDTTQDAMLVLLITAMREHAELITGRAFSRRRLELRLDKLPSGGEAITLPYPPLVSVEYLHYLDAAGALQTQDGSPTPWNVDAGSEPGRVQPFTGDSWPSTGDQIAAARFGFTCGYGTPTSVPKLLRIWMQARIATIFDNREQLVMNNVVEIPRDFCDGLLDGLRVNFFA